MLGIDPVIIDPTYLYVVPTIITYYDTLRANIGTSAIQSLVRNSIINYSSNNLEQFGKRLRYSRFVRELDNTDDAVLNNEASFQMQKRFVPSTTNATLVELEFHNPIVTNSISSTSFTFNTFVSQLDDDGLGNIRIFRFNTNKEKVFIDSTAGTIDYTTGKLSMSSFLVSAYDGIEIKVSADPINKDIVPVREQVIIISSADATINTQAEVSN
tara:strand:- start:600 stop:1238 length:639 start_codon:yes stop_codon:yes gene_type:complete